MLKQCCTYVPAVVILGVALTVSTWQFVIASQARGDHTACHGTTIEFVDTPIAAAKLAVKQKKLVFILHVSGHFEDPTFT